MFGDHGLCGLLEESAHEKSPKCLGGNLGDFGEFCKGLILIARRVRPAPEIIWENEPLICISLGNLLDNERIYFGKNEIFICEGSEIKARHPLQDLIYLSRTMMALFGTHVWRLEFRADGSQVAYHFYPKADGFAIFYKQLVQNHPRTIMDCWSEWRR